MADEYFQLKGLNNKQCINPDSRVGRHSGFFVAFFRGRAECPDFTSRQPLDIPVFAAFYPTTLSQASSSQDEAHQGRSSARTVGHGLADIKRATLIRTSITSMGSRFDNSYMHFVYYIV